MMLSWIDVSRLLMDGCDHLRVTQGLLFVAVTPTVISSPACVDFSSSRATSKVKKLTR
jgi:hypothetical protein